MEEKEESVCVDSCSNVAACLSVTQLVLNVNQPPADSAALVGFVFLNSSPNLLLILYARISPKPPQTPAALPKHETCALTGLTETFGI